MNIEESKQPLPRTRGPKQEAVPPFAPRILLAEDDDEMRILLTWSLRWEGYDVVECRNGTELLDALSGATAGDEADGVALVISDIRMPGMSGLDVLRGLRHSERFPSVVLITAFGDEETHAEADRLGAVALFDKPFEIEDLVAKVHDILHDRKHSAATGRDEDAAPA